MDLGYTCVDSLCTGEVSGQCTGDLECVILYSGWSGACTLAGNECAITQACISVDGGGLCGYAPGEFIDCATLQMEEVSVTGIDGQPLIVCGRPNAACNDSHYCSLPCTDDSGCASAAYPHCNVGTGTCECGQDSDCATLASPQYSVCNAGACGCDSDQNCVDGSVGDVCNSGFCGCTNDMACEDVPSSFDGGVVECVAF